MENNQRKEKKKLKEENLRLPSVSKKIPLNCNSSKLIFQKM
jgi:hypothetical protein